jgi:L-ascorbate metabolism protein UlaG (beta-lactamase superfamily)
LSTRGNGELSRRSQDDLVLLADGVAIEPLVDGWPAWLMLLDPVSAGFYRRHHIEMLASYVLSPLRHHQAAHDPRLAGGPFCDLASVPLAVVEAWAQWYQETSKPVVRFASDLGFLMRGRAEFGDSLEYEKLPSTLSGRVELRYLLSGEREVRVLRGVNALRSELGVAAWKDGSHRPSMFATPRLAGDYRFTVAKGRAAQVADVSGLHHIPLPRAVAVDRLADVGLPEAAMLRPANSHRSPRRAMRFLGHASMAVPLRHGWLVTDPVPPATCRAAQSLEDVAVVLVTHAHPDHLSIEALLALMGQQPMVIVPSGSGSPIDPAVAPVLRALGFGQVIEMRPYEQITAAGVVITALPFLGEHGSLPIDSKAAFHVATGVRSVVFAADATGLDPSVFRDLPIASGIEMLVIGMEPAGAPARWLYGPVLEATAGNGQLGSERMRGASAEEAIDLADALGVKAIKVYGTGAPGMGHVFTRSDDNVARVGDEIKRLCDISPGRGIGVEVLDEPGSTVETGHRA